MQGIIRQPPAVPTLPDLRNLGTILRILVAVNGATLAISLAREPRLPLVVGEWARLTGFVEPHLFAELAVLWLAGLRGPVAIAVVTLVTCMIGIGSDALTPRMAGEAPGALVRHLLFAL